MVSIMSAVVLASTVIRTISITIIIKLLVQFVL